VICVLLTFVAIQELDVDYEGRLGNQYVELRLKSFLEEKINLPEGREKTQYTSVAKRGRSSVLYSNYYQTQV